MTQPRPRRFDIFLYGISAGRSVRKHAGNAKKIRAPSRTDPASHRRERYQSAGDEAALLNVSFFHNAYN